jgi:hypothetical protein
LLEVLASSLDLLVATFISKELALDQEFSDFGSRPVDGVLSRFHIK